MNVLLCTLALFCMTADQAEISRDADTLLYIRTVPSGAQILLNGKPLGSSDGLFPVKPGKYKIVVDLEGHEPHKQEVTIVNGKIKRIVLELTPSQTEREQVTRTVMLPDVDRRDGPTVLDLASGQLIENIAREGDASGYAALGKGDLWQDDGYFGTVRGANAMLWDGTQFAPFETVRPVGGTMGYGKLKLPCRLLVSTAEKTPFDVTILWMDGQGSARIDYRLADPSIVPKDGADNHVAVPVSPKNNHRAAAVRATVASIKTALQMYKLDTGQYPTTVQGLDALIKRPDDMEAPGNWRGPYLNATSIPLDPWGHTYQYYYVAKYDNPMVWSKGQDDIRGAFDSASLSETLARRMKSGSNLSSIGKAMLIYANDHDDMFPPNFDALVEEVDLHPKYLMSPSRPEGFAGPDYVYVGGQEVSMPPMNVIAYENPAYCQDGINVLYLDSHVAWEKREEFLKALAATYKRLGKPMPNIQTKKADVVSRTEILANRMISATNLSGIGKAILIYANDHDDRLPPNLEILVSQAELHPKLLVSPRKPEGFAGADYIYVAGQDISMPPRNVIAYENPAYCQDGINVLYMDSHVSWEKREEFLKALAATYKRLGKPMPNIQTKKADVVSRTEILANRMISATNLSGIGKAMLIYANDHDDRLPPSLETLVSNAELHPKQLVSPSKPERFAGPSYVYIAGQTPYMDPRNIVAYENPAYCQDGINVLYLDSHVAWEKPDEFLRALQATYKRLDRFVPDVQFKTSDGPGSLDLSNIIFEKTIQDLDEGKGHEAIDLDTAKQYDLSVHGDGQGGWGIVNQLVRQSGVDLLADYASNRWALMTSDLALKKYVPNEFWDRLGPAEVQTLVSLPQEADQGIEILDRNGFRFYILDRLAQAPQTFAFKTNQGALGMLQITEYQAKPRAIKIRYKLVKGPTK